MRRTLGLVIGLRHLRETGLKRRVVTVRLGRPRRTGHDWLCPFHVSGLEDSQVQYAHGVDAIRALFSAMEGILGPHAADFLSYAETGRSVVLSMVAGTINYRDGRFTNLDADEVHRRLLAAGERLQAAAADPGTASLPIVELTRQGRI
jgi:hypothetical protein